MTEIPGWQEDYSVQIAEIDQQHQQLFILIDQFHKEINKKDAKYNQLGKLLEELVEYAATHFKTEEGYFKDHPDFAMHHQVHYAFIKQLNQFERDYLAGTAELAEDMIDFLRNWLINHIMETDKRYLKGLG